MARKSTAKEKERGFIIECIQLYRDLPALWNVKSKIYHDRDKKNRAYDLLLRKYNEMFPDASRDDLKRKLNALRTNYRKELRKHLASMKSGSSTDSIYEPTLWYYNEMVFLQDQEAASDSECSTDTTQNSTMKLKDSHIEQNTVNGISTLDDSDDDVTPPTPSKKYASKKAKTEEKLMNLACEHLSETRDEYYHWAMACAADLRKMNRTQQLYAKKAFAEILMEGQLGLLHRDSVKINESPLHPHYTSLPYGSMPSSTSPVEIVMEDQSQNLDIKEENENE